MDPKDSNVFFFRSPLGHTRCLLIATLEKGLLLHIHAKGGPSPALAEVSADSTEFLADSAETWHRRAGRNELIRSQTWPTWAAVLTIATGCIFSPRLCGCWRSLFQCVIQLTDASFPPIATVVVAVTRSPDLAPVRATALASRVWADAVVEKRSIRLGLTLSRMAAMEMGR